MTNNTLSNRLIFNEKIDSDYLFSLYADDFVCIEEIFATTLENYDQDIEAVKLAYSNGDVQDLRKAIHKIKPAFGFVGMLEIQQQCKEFEDLCHSQPSFESLQPSYKLLINNILDAKFVLEGDHRKLKEFNGGAI